MAFVRKVKTGSGATAVQIVEKRHGRRRILEHIGSAHDEAELAVLLSVARQRLHAPQEALPELAPSPAEPGAVPGPVVEHSASVLLWQVLQNAYQELGFDVVDDAVFAQLVAARLIEPTSKLDTLRVLGELGVTAPHSNTLYACLGRCVARDYRSQIAAACWAHATADSAVALVMYDLTTLLSRSPTKTDSARSGCPKNAESIRRSPSGCWSPVPGFRWRLRCSREIKRRRPR